MSEAVTRRGVLGAGVYSAGSALVLNARSPSTGLANARSEATPECHDGDAATLPEIEGPFFKPSSPNRTNLFEPGMAGQPLELMGFVLTMSCKPVSGALIDFWQANGTGEYDNLGFHLRGHQFTDALGRYRLRTIVPGLYYGRARHIHVKVQPRSGRLLTTQLYFPGEPKNSSDGLFRHELLIRAEKNTELVVGRFDFVLDMRVSS
jgi:protocatechuate 3,4-dioxygenase beta subunit